MEIYHFSHRHPLILQEVNDTDCMICYRNITGPSYGCGGCMFYIHESCCELPEEIQHPFHLRHRLSLQETTGFTYCDACDLKIEGFSYRCSKCDFDLHSDCASLKPNIKYEGHEHLLILIENMSYHGLCLACGFEIHGVFFVRCVECDVSFHVQCDNRLLPEAIAHQCHSHLLILKTESHAEAVNGSLSCDVCKNKINAKHPAYCCAECEFYAHVRCVITEVKLGKKGKLDHFSHPHPLFLLENKRNDDPNFCYACQKGIRGLAYGCDVCRFYLHESCTELSREIQHPFHRHTLSLNVTRAGVGHQCNACGTYFNGYTYSCSKCGFDLDLDCALLWPSVKFEGHSHFLTFFAKLCGNSNCIACNSISPGAPYFRCVECDFNIHFTCCSLPETIKHWSHRCLLTLERDDGSDYVCGICDEEMNSQEYVYCCAKCSFKAEINCAISEVILSATEKTLTEASNEVTNIQQEDIERLRHFTHPEHFLFPHENGDNDNVLCHLCQKDIRGPSYRCDLCNYYLHQSCAKLQETTMYAFHRHHLNLQKVDTVDRPCNACRKSCEGLIFSCHNCNFDLHADCRLLEPSITIKGYHDHSLALFEKLQGTPRCIGCNFTPATASYLRCVRCDFNVHVWCCPLPATIEHKSHPHHRLTLMEKFVDKEYDYEICDVCEEKRNREECVYYCRECYFVAEFNCVISEVISSLKGESTRNVASIIIQGEIPYKAIEKRLIVQDILDRFTKEDNAKTSMWEDIRLESEHIIKTSTTGASEGDANYSGMSPYLVKAFSKLIPKLGSEALKRRRSASKKFWDSCDEVVTVGYYKISRKLAPLLKKLTAKYGDFGSKFRNSECLMTVLLLRLCEVVLSMHETKVTDITDELMFNWWHQLKFVQNGELEIDFAFDHLNRIAQARDVIDTEDYQKSPLHGLEEKMAKHTDEIEDLMEKVTELEKQKMRVISQHSETSGRDPKRLTEALELIIRNAGAGLLGHFEITADGETDSIRLFKSKLERH